MITISIDVASCFLGMLLGAVLTLICLGVVFK